MGYRCILFILLVACASGQHDDRLSPPVQQLMDDYFYWRMTDMPEYASFVGIHDYDDRLDDMSMAAHQGRYDKCQDFLAQAQDLEGNLTLHVDLLNIKALKNDLLTYIDGFAFQGFLHPLCYSEGVHTNFEQLITWMVFQTPEDYEKLLSRYNHFPQQLNQVQQLMEEGVNQGIVHHAISMKGVAESLLRFVVGTAEESPLWQPFTSFPTNFTHDQEANFQERARAIILDQISPGFQRLHDYVANEYVTRPEIAITSLPNGDARYNQLIKFHTSTGMRAEDIHAKGLEEVMRIENEMAEIVAALGYNMSVPDFSAMIKNDSHFFYDSAEHLMQGFEELVYNVIPPRLGQVFINIPKAVLSVVPDPSPDGPGAFYLAGSYDGSRPGIFYVNTYHYDAQPKYEMMTLSLHEGNPGHHLQGSHSIESLNTPYFRRVNEDRNYCHSPSRFPLNTAFGEGWGLYAESLGFDMDLYGDLYDRYGHYSDEIFRAIRLVVDTGMHALGWTREEAINYMFQHTAMTLVDVENEIDRYITWPGQALAYKIGQLKLTELRQEASNQLGDGFDIRRFHDIVLDSVGPLDLVEEEVNFWINGGGN